jgi:hypothetical protein
VAAGQRFWQLVLWWIAAMAALWWCLSRTDWSLLACSAAIQGLYLWIFWPSLSGFGTGLSVGLWAAVTVVSGLVYAED